MDDPSRAIWVFMDMKVFYLCCVVYLGRLLKRMKFEGGSTADSCNVELHHQLVPVARYGYYYCYYLSRPFVIPSAFLLSVVQHIPLLHPLF